MPPRKYKTNHHARGKKVSSADDIIARNQAEDGEDPGKGKGKGKSGGYKKEDEEEESGSEEEEQKQKPKKSGAAAAGVVVENPNAKPRNEEVEGIGELSRKQREELEKQAARRRYEELHKAGKTDEAKADLARLEEVKKRREEAAKKRADEEAEQKAKLEEKMKASGMSKEVKDALGGEAARMRGERSQMKKSAPRVKNEVNLYSYVDGAGEKPVEEKNFTANDGSINACRAAEDDFM